MPSPGGQHQRETRAERDRPRLVQIGEHGLLLPVGAAGAERKLTRRTKLRTRVRSGDSPNHIGIRVELEQISMRQKSNTVDLAPTAPGVTPRRPIRSIHRQPAQSPELRRVPPTAEFQRIQPSSAVQPAVHWLFHSGFKSPCQETVSFWPARPRGGARRPRGDGFSTTSPRRRSSPSAPCSLPGRRHAERRALFRTTRRSTRRSGNSWNYYQAKSNKQNLAELAATLPGVDPEKYRADVARYKGEKEDIKKRPRREASSTEWNHKSDVAMTSTTSGRGHHRRADRHPLAAITLLTRRSGCRARLRHCRRRHRAGRLHPAARRSDTR